jgi:hypothetical protein
LLKLESVPIRLRGLRTKENQNEPADHRKEVQELPPPTSIDVVQTTRRNRNARQERRKGEHGSQVIAESSKRYGYDQSEHEPTPKLRTGRAAIEFDIFYETGLNSVDKIHESCSLSKPPSPTHRCPI